MHRKVVGRRLHPSQVKTQQVHAIIPIDRDPWTWRKLRNVQDVAQQGPDGQSSVKFVSSVPTQRKDKIHNTLQVAPRGGKLAPGTCSKLPAHSAKRSPTEGSSSGTSRTERSAAKRQLPAFELDVIMPDDDPPYVVRQAKSARGL